MFVKNRLLIDHIVMNGPTTIPKANIAVI